MRTIRKRVSNGLYRCPGAKGCPNEKGRGCIFSVPSTTWIMAVRNWDCQLKPKSVLKKLILEE